MRKPALTFVPFLLSLLLAVPLRAQVVVPETSSDEVLRALLSEIRQLRVAMQKNQAHEVRAQILLERLRIQQQTVKELSQQVEHSPYETTEIATDGFDMHLADVQARLKAETDPQRRTQIEREIQMIGKRREMELKHREQAAVRRSQMEVKLKEESDRLASLEDQLQRLERELTQSP